MTSIISDDIRQAMHESSWIRKMFETGNELKNKLGPENVFDLSLGNPVIEPPKEFFEAVAQRATNPDKGSHRYMNNAGFEEVRDSIARDLRQRNILNTSKEQINMCVGAGGGLNVLLKALINPGDEVIILAPYFVEYLFYIKNQQGVPVAVNLGQDFDLDIENIQKALTAKTRAVLLCSPNNPTGSVLSEGKIAALHQLLLEHNKRCPKPVMLLSDEPYREIYYGDAPLPATVRDYPHSAIIYSWSKTLSIPGERIGYIAVNENNEDKELNNAITFCTRILGFVNAPALMQWVIKDLIHCAAPLEPYKKLRDKLIKGLHDMGFECVTPMGAFYAFPKVPKRFDGDDVAFVRAAQKEAVLFVPGSGFGWPGNFRISYAVEEQVLDNAIIKMEALK
jgi:aspartate aminotransferase